MSVERKRDYLQFLNGSRFGLLVSMVIQCTYNSTNFLVEYILNIISKFSLLFSNPIQACTFGFIVPIVYMIILGIKILVALFRIFIPNNALNSIKSKYFNDFSVLNWRNIDVLSEEHDHIVLAGVEILKNENELHQFNTTVAKMSTILSSLVYERLSYIKERTRRSYNFDYTRIHDYELKFSIENSIPIQFESVHIFYSAQKNLIIVAFKGTDMFNLKDNHIDAISKKGVASQWLFGEVHSGFYRTLFSKYREPTAVSSKISNVLTDKDPFAFLGNSAFISTINSIKRIVFNKFKKQQPVLFVTGHGTGAALATLFHCRLIRVPMTVPVKFVGSYVLSCPHVGSFDFCASWLSTENITRINSGRCPNLWRIVAGNDPLSDLPLSAHQGSNPFGGYILDFGHVGKGVHLHHDNTFRYVISIADVNYADLYFDSWRFFLIDLYFPIKNCLITLKNHSLSLNTVGFSSYIKGFIFIFFKMGMLPLNDHLTSTYFKLLTDCRLDQNVQVEYS